MRALVRAYLALSIIGAARSIRRGRPARLLGLHYPGTVVQQACTIGTAASPPPLLALAFWWAGRRHDARLTRLLAAGFVAGVLGEPDTLRTLRRPAADPVGAAVAALQVVVPAAIVVDRR